VSRPAILLSYHYWRDLDVAQVAERFPEPPWIFADSGAFSASKALGSNVKRNVEPVTTEGFADWLDRWAGLIQAVCTMDELGDFDATRRNTEYLWERGHQAIPVFHVGEPWSWLDYWCEHYRYIGLGGMVPWSKQRAVVLRWVITAMRVAEQAGVKVHGLGQTGQAALANIPFFSVDSSTWVAFQRFGDLTLWDAARQRMVPVPRDPTPRSAALLRHFGIDPAEYRRRSYGVGLRLAPDGRAIDQVVAERLSLRLASMRSWMEVQDWMARRHGAIDLEGHDPGPHVCLVLMHDEDARDAATAAYHHRGVSHAPAAPA